MPASLTQPLERGLVSANGFTKGVESGFEKNSK